MQKTEFIEHVAKEAGTTKSEADKVVRAVIKSIQDILTNGDKISLIGFGTFEVRERAERSGTNPRTREKITIAGGKVPAFSAGSEFKAAVSGRAKDKAAASAPAASGESGAGKGQEKQKQEEKKKAPKAKA
jgi:DNA-binding protein HU-beta